MQLRSADDVGLLKMLPSGNYADLKARQRDWRATRGRAVATMGAALDTINSAEDQSRVAILYILR